MADIFAAKQVGDLSYYVKSKAIVRNIIITNQIQTSSGEVNPNTGKKGKDVRFVSFSRDLTSTPKRNPGKWKYGLVIDGNKLSNSYHIEPFAFTGTIKNIRIKSLIRYDSGICLIEAVNWGRSKISREFYEELKSAILNLPDESKDKHMLTISGPGKYNTKNGKIVEKLLFISKIGDGGEIFKSNKFLNISSLTKSDRYNEKEERLWTDTDLIDISGCIKGIILPYDEYKNFNESGDPELIKLKEVCDRYLKQYITIFY